MSIQKMLKINGIICSVDSCLQNSRMLICHINIKQLFVLAESILNLILVPLKKCYQDPDKFLGKAGWLQQTAQHLSWERTSQEQGSVRDPSNKTLLKELENKQDSKMCWGYTYQKVLWVRNRRETKIGSYLTDLAKCVKFNFGAVQSMEKRPMHNKCEKTASNLRSDINMLLEHISTIFSVGEEEPMALKVFLDIPFWGECMPPLNSF